MRSAHSQLLIFKFNLSIIETLYESIRVHNVVAVPHPRHTLVKKKKNHSELVFLDLQSNRSYFFSNVGACLVPEMTTTLSASFKEEFSGPTGARSTSSPEGKYILSTRSRLLCV